MNFMDIAYLRVYQIENGRLQYRRRKTRWSSSAKKFDIEHSPSAQKIIDYYTKGKKGIDFVFPIISDFFHLNDTLDDKEQEASNKRSFQLKLNGRRTYHIKRLKEISKRAGLKENVSTYVGRHSFFSIALRNGISKSEISELAGHSSYQITENYLAGFNGEQLAASANMVRDAVAQHTHKKTSVLDNKITLNDTGEQQTIVNFFNKTWADAPKKERTSVNLLMALLQQTDCQDGIKAQQYVNCFLQSQEKDTATIATKGL